MLDKEPGLKIVLEGHTDYKGTHTYNEKLGMDRAEAVRKELIALGVPADRLATVTLPRLSQFMAIRLTGRALLTAGCKYTLKKMPRNQSGKQRRSKRRLERN